MAVSIDGGIEVDVDCYQGSRQENVLIFDSGALDIGPHRIQIRITGRKNASSSNYYISLDRADIDNSPVTVTINDNTKGTEFNEFQYLGNWGYGNQNGAYQTDNHWSGNKDDLCRVRFFGTSIKLYGAKADNYGMMAVSIDGGSEIFVDCYQASRQEDVLIYECSNLPSGPHTLRVRITGVKNSNSSNTYISIDRVGIINYPSYLDINDTITGTENNKIEYVGNWGYGGQAGAFMTDNHWSDNTGGYFRIRFNGTRIVLYGAKAEDYGIMAISIDGGPEVDVDCYSANRWEFIPIYSSPQLNLGQHVVQVRVKGQKIAASSGYNISLDRASIVSAPAAPTDIIAAEFDADGNMEENKYLYNDSGSVITDGLRRNADGNASWTYRFDLANNTTTVEMKLDIANNYVISGSSDGVNWKVLEDAGGAQGLGSMVFDFSTLLYNNPSKTIYLKFSAGVINGGHGVGLRYLRLNVSSGGPVTRQRDSKVVATQYPTSDIAVADFNVADYGVDSTGVDDSTEYIQMAINDCYYQGGGTVWLPAGKYRVTKTIDIRSFVTLRGDWRDPDTTGSGYGTVIIADVSSTSLDTPGLFRIGGSAGAMGLTVYYPNQNATNPIPYPYTFEIPGVAYMNYNNFMMQSVVNCTMLNSYKGICYSATPADREGASRTHEMANVSNIRGTVLYKGVTAYDGSDVGTFENVKLDNFYWANAGAGYNAPSKSALDSWTRENGTAFTFSDIEWDEFIGLQASNYNVGIKIESASRSAFSGQFYGCSIQNTNTAIYVEASFIYGVQAIRSTFQGTTSVNTNSDRVQFTDCTLSGATYGTFTQTNPGTTPAQYVWKSNLPKPSSSAFIDVTAAPYNADNTGINDATQAIQSALNALVSSGGGTAYLPAGKYRISTHLTVPANVELRGSSPIPSRDQYGCSKGTVIMGYEGKGTTNPYTDTALITLNGNNSGARGFRLFYPASNPVNGINAYPYSIRGNGNGVYAINIGFTGVYNGIDFKTNRCDGHYISKIIGTAYNRGIVIGPSNEGWVEGCLNNPNAVNRTQFAGWDNSTFDNTRDFTMENLIYISIDGASNEHVLNNFVFAARYLFYCNNASFVAINSASDYYHTAVWTQSGQVALCNFYKSRGYCYKGIAPVLYNWAWQQSGYGMQEP